MRVLRTVSILVCVALVSAPAHAIYGRVVTEDVPVARLIDNLTRQVAARPGDGPRHWALARAHAMAASRPTGTLPLTKEGHIWHGHDVPFAPFPGVPAAAPGSPSRRHLDLAITHHRRALELMPGDTAVRLGLAWCLEQAGQKEAAVREYRATIEAAWKEEGKRSSLGMGGRTVVAEAAGYLIPLLHPMADREEIRRLRQRLDHLASLPVPITPIVIDLAGDASGRPLVDAQRRARFDLEGRGVARDWEWITPRAAWLVWDPRQTGHVTSGRQLFGSVTFLMAWRTGYDALASLDNDGNGWLEGAELAGLALWHDRDGNGLSTSGEVRPVSWYRISGIAARGVPGSSDRVAAWARDGVRYANGASAPTYDVMVQPAAPLSTRRRGPAAVELDAPIGRQARHAGDVRR